MSTETITIELSGSLAQELSTANQQFLIEILERGLREVKVEQLLNQYSRGSISFGVAAQQAGVSQSELARYAHAKGLEPPFSNETLAEELSS
jgi:hypothetical protein